jgi:hypothetical protein
MRVRVTLEAASGPEHHPMTDLRAVYTASAPVEAAELRRLRGGRPSLSQIAAASHAYHYRGDATALAALFGIGSGSPGGG